MSIKIQVASDLHLRVGNMPDPLDFSTDADVLVLAGDVSELKKGKVPGDVLDWVCALSHPLILWIPGNHEYWRADYDSLVLKVRSQLPKHIWFGNRATIHHLETRIHLATLWTNFAGGNPLDMEVARGAMRDYDMVRHGGYAHRWHPSKVLEEHYKDLQFLKNACRPGDVVVTHHAPIYQSIDPKFRGHRLNSSFASHLDYDVLEMQPSLWIHGHVHCSNDYLIEDTRVLSNPRGYDGHEKQTQIFNPRLVVEA